MAGLEKSLERFGVVEPIIVNNRDGKMTVVGGHQRLKVLRRMKVASADVVVVDLDDTDEKALNLALNNPAITGEFSDKLADLLSEVEQANSTLFADLRLDQLLAEADAKRRKFLAQDDLDEAPDPPAVPVTQLGDVWVLDRHRLVCGDSADPAVIAALMQGERASLTFTSPPYNAGSNKLSGNLTMRASRYQGTADHVEQDVYLELLKGFTVAALAVSETVCVNLQQLAGNKLAVIDYLAHFREHFIDLAIWDKGQAAPPMQANVLSSQFEFLIFLGPVAMPSRAIPSAAFRGTVRNVYAGPPQQHNEFYSDHAATFPVHLPFWALESFTMDGAIIMDPFAGTGITGIACEGSHRRARLVELDPAYCDVIVERWQALTGGKAVRNGNPA